MTSRLVLLCRVARSLAFLGAGVAIPLLMTQCASKGYGSYKDIEYSPEKLATPAGHGMVKKDYPFDDSGQYRRDWVKNKSGGRTASSYASYRPGTTSSMPSSAEDAGSGDLSYVGTAGAAAPAAYGSPATSPAAATPSVAPSTTTVPAARYHQVVGGDTLYSIASRNGVSVAELKRVNGLSGDTIYKGQSLRLP